MKKEYLIINDLVADQGLNGTERAVEYMRAEWVKGESLGTEHLRVYEMKIYEAGEKATEMIVAAADEAYAKAYKDWAGGRGGIVHEVLVPIDTPESLKVAVNAGKRTPQQELAEKGYVIIDQAVTKGALMAKYERGTPPEPPPDILEYIKRKLTEEKPKEVEAKLEVVQECNQNEIGRREDAETQLREWDEERIPRLNLVGELIRGDWSGTEFDGRDVRDWIDLILGGKYGEFDDEVKPYAEDSALYVEIVKRKEIKENDL
jgi:hypothetical protein